MTNESHVLQKTIKLKKEKSKKKETKVTVRTSLQGLPKPATAYRKSVEHMREREFLQSPCVWAQAGYHQSRAPLCLTYTELCPQHLLLAT